MFVKRQIAVLVPVHLQPSWQQHLDLVHLPETPSPEQPMNPIGPAVQPKYAGVARGVAVGRRNLVLLGRGRCGGRVRTGAGCGRWCGRSRTNEGVSWPVLFTSRCHCQPFRRTKGIFVWRSRRRTRFRERKGKGAYARPDALRSRRPERIAKHLYGTRNPLKIGSVGGTNTLALLNGYEKFIDLERG